MNSCLYRCRVVHNRSKPKRHRFVYPCFVFSLELDELEQLSRKLTLFSYGKRNLYSLLDTDHLKNGKTSIKENLIAYLREKGVQESIGSIRLVTNLRTWGYVFNPVSFYFVDDANGRPLCVVAEVANTFNEQKLYLVDQQNTAPGKFRQSHQKLFYISPFSEPDTFLNFDLNSPGSRIKLIITEHDQDGLYFSSMLKGDQHPLTNFTLFAYSLRFPFMTTQVIAAIHWQAARLYLKKVPFFRKKHRPDLQRETRVYLENNQRSA